MEKISIITASYNYAYFIGEAIESVLAQTYQDWELIIVDDGSTDNSIEIIQKYCKKDKRIKFFTHEGNINKGLAQTIKFALTKCTGEWVAFLESDDIFMPDSLEQKVKIAQQYSDIAIIFSDMEMFGNEAVIEKDKEFFQDSKDILNKLQYPTDISKFMFRDNLISTFSVVMVKKKVIEKCDFNSPINACLDWYLWSQIVYCGVYYIDKKLTKWRRHETSYINSVQSLPTEFRIAIAKLLIKNNKFLYFKYLKYYKRRFIRFHLFNEPQIWIFDKPLIKKNNLGE